MGVYFPVLHSRFLRWSVQGSSCLTCHTCGFCPQGAPQDHSQHVLFKQQEGKTQGRHGPGAALPRQIPGHGHMPLLLSELVLRTTLSWGAGEGGGSGNVASMSGTHLTIRNCSGPRRVLCLWKPASRGLLSSPCPLVAQKIVATRKKQQLSIGPCKSLPNSPSHSSVCSAQVSAVHISQVRGAHERLDPKARLSQGDRACPEGRPPAARWIFFFFSTF